MGTVGIADATHSPPTLNAKSIYKIADNTVRFNWTPPAESQGFQYEVTISFAGIAYSLPLTTENSITRNVEPDMGYIFFVRSINDGEPSDYVSRYFHTGSDALYLHPPTNLKAITTAWDYIQFKFETLNPDFHIIQHKVEYKIAGTNTWTTQYNTAFPHLSWDILLIRGLEEGTTYQIRVSEVTPVGNSLPSNILTVTTTSNTP